MLKMMLEVVILTDCVFYCCPGHRTSQGIPRCCLPRDKSTVLLVVINESSFFKYFTLLCEVEQSEAEFRNSHIRPKIK